MWHFRGVVGEGLEVFLCMRPPTHVVVASCNLECSERQRDRETERWVKEGYGDPCQCSMVGTGDGGRRKWEVKYDSARQACNK